MTPAELKKWRTSRHLTQSQAAALVGKSRYQTWQDWERGVSPVPWLVAEKLKLLDNEKGVTRL